MRASHFSCQGGEAVSRLAHNQEVAGSNPAPATSFPAPVSPKRRAPGRSGASVSRWRTAPANSFSVCDTTTVIPGCPHMSGRSRHEWQARPPYRGPATPFSLEHEVASWRQNHSAPIFGRPLRFATPRAVLSLLVLRFAHISIGKSYCAGRSKIASKDTLESLGAKTGLLKPARPRQYQPAGHALTRSTYQINTTVARLIRKAQYGLSFSGGRILKSSSCPVNSQTHSALPS